MAVVAKFKVTRIERSQWSNTTGEEVQTIVLHPVGGGIAGESEENKRFFRATPNGEIKLGTVNEAAAAAFVLGAEYYVTFEQAE